MRFSRIFIPVILVSITFTLSISQSQQHRADISGVWRSNIGQVYIVEVRGNRFTWHVEELGQDATGTIDGSRLTAAWGEGRRQQSATGNIIDVDESGRALRIEWSNGVVFLREGQGQPPEIREEQPPLIEGRGGDIPRPEEEFRRAVVYLRDHWQRRYGLVTVA